MKKHNKQDDFLSTLHKYRYHIIFFILSIVLLVLLGLVASDDGHGMNYFDHRRIQKGIRLLREREYDEACGALSQYSCGFDYQATALYNYSDFCRHVDPESLSAYLQGEAPAGKTNFDNDHYIAKLYLDDQYDGEFSDEIRTIKSTIYRLYADDKHNYTKAEEREVRLLLPYSGMKEVLIDKTKLGAHEYFYEDYSFLSLTGYRRAYSWFSKDDEHNTIFIAECNDEGVVTHTYKYNEDKYWNGDSPDYYASRYKSQMRAASSSAKNRRHYYSSSKKRRIEYEMPDCDDYDSFEDFMDDWDGCMPDGSDAEEYWDDW